MDPQFISDLFAPFGPVAVRRMFGGAGLYRDGLMFALEFDGVIFLRVDEASIPDFEREESGQDRPRLALLLAPARAPLRRSGGARGLGRARARHRPAEESRAAPT